jgi:hypothetical protein
MLMQKPRMKDWSVVSGNQIAVRDINRCTYATAPPTRTRLNLPTCLPSYLAVRDFNSLNIKVISRVLAQTVALEYYEGQVG